MVRKQWTREQVIKELRRLRRRERIRITKPALQRSGHGDVVAASVKLFGTLTAARRAAAIPKPATLPRSLKYTREYVLAVIKARVLAKHPLNMTAVPKSLVYAAKREFGGWGQAIQAAGLDYSTIRLKKERWTNREIIAAIRAGAKTGRTGVGPHGFITRGLLSVATGHFGSLRAAITAAGLDADALLRWKPRRTSEFRAKIEQLARERPEMTRTEFHYHPLGHALRARLGNIRNALRMWGIRNWPVDVHPTAEPRARRGFWNAARVVAAIHERRRNGQPLANNEAPQRLVAAAKTYIGSWRLAIERAGLDYNTIRRGPAAKPSIVAITGEGWTRPRLLDELRRLHKDGRIRITSTSLNKSGYSGLVTACLKRFGSFLKARRLAGIPVPSAIPRPRSLTREDVVLMITARVRDGAPVNASSFRPSIYGSVLNLFGTWDAALTASGVDVEFVRREVVNRVSAARARARAHRAIHGG